jgi:hypothetical protein
MKQLLLLSLVLWGGLPQGGNGAPLPVLPADTVVGHAQLVRGLMQTVCSELTNRKAAAVQKRTPAEALQAAQQLYAQCR